MFETLTSSLTAVLQRMQSKHIISSEDFDAAMEEVKVALLEADVALSVVKDFIGNIRNKIVGETTVRGVLPTQMIIKRIQDCLIEVLGVEKQDLNLSAKPFAVVMMVGLQGVGKTTTTAKLALRLKNNNKEVLMASLDLYRPAAQTQLEILGKQIEVDTLPIIEKQQPVDIAARAIAVANESNYDVLIFDTAGRLHVDEMMMEELKAIKSITSPSEVILVADAMIGQDAVNVVKSFNDHIGITGIILTRIDGDSRGGAALSMKMSTGTPIKFLATGEKLSDLDDFYPDRIARRILNMGDVVSLVEKATEAVGKSAIDEMQKKAQKGKFDLNDLVQQLKALNKLGGISNILKFMPNFGSAVKRQVSGIANDSRVKQYIAIVNSMTKKERENPKILNGARKTRISKGSGVPINVINMLIKQFNQMSSLMNKFSKVDYNKIKDADFMNLLKNNE
ncbi:signal recognition particle protein [Ehrlichia ruminantium]|uniref:signal-recognition-particle GTPase n=1 Tax=Ehrlichia ruminantium TaxID=779 RepID=A0AAE6Q953_EHRRU|nr:signal recognition particle protein [Ehrlichia ruminantium]QGR02607.1 signal recognition particle protein [Ehrlichia ruminantium]QGR03527.1 signal recognition particle protein [Ehrlichia ruminantium]QGR04454.1 signal recognition particle protein [Ehrlichia ruminantium]